MFTNRSQIHMKIIFVVELWTGQRLAGLWQTGWRVGGWQVAGGWRAGDRRVAGGWLVVSWWVLTVSSRWVAGRRVRLAMRRVGLADGWGRRAPAGGAGRWERPEPRRSAAPS